MYNHISGIILSGGKSSRMGQNKSFLRYGSENAIERTYKLMKDMFDEVLLITNQPELFEYIHVPIFNDLLTGFGPLSGIHSGLVHSHNNLNFVISCDMPFVTPQLIDFITNYPSLNDIIIAKADGYLQQLCGIYTKNLIKPIEKAMLKGKNEENREQEQKQRKCNLHSLINNFGATIIDAEKEYPAYFKELFYNVNTIDDYKYALSRLH